MPKFVIYEVWTRARVIEADDQEAAYNEVDPDGYAHADVKMNLCNWHVVPVPEVGADINENKEAKTTVLRRVSPGPRGRGRRESR